MNVPVKPQSGAALGSKWQEVREQPLGVVWGKVSSSMWHTQQEAGYRDMGKGTTVAAVARAPLYGLQAVGFCEDSRKGQHKQLISFT